MRLRMRAASAVAGALATGLILGGLAVGALALGTASAAWAAPSTEVVQGRYLRLVSTADWSQAMRLMPGEAVRWDVEISADAPEPGTIDIGVSASGGAELVADARLCGEAWQGEVCPPGAQSLRTDWEVPRDGIVATLASIPADEVAHLRLDIRLGAAAAGSTEMRVHADGMGEGVDVGPGLPPTGGQVPYPIIFGGVGVLAVGAALLIAAGVRRRRGGNDDGGDA